MSLYLLPDPKPINRIDLTDAHLLIIYLCVQAILDDIPEEQIEDNEYAILMEEILSKLDYIVK